MRVQPSSPTVLFLEILARLGIDPRTLVTSPTHRNGRLVVGNSETTLGKLWESFRIIDVVAAIAETINTKRQRSHRRVLDFPAIDLSAGIGAYLSAGPTGGIVPVVGTSFQLLDAVVRYRLPYRLALVEQHPTVLEQLKTNLELACTHLGVDQRRINLLEGDVADLAIPWIRGNVQPWMNGLMLIDMNEVFDDPSLRAIGELPELNHVDVALHLPAAMGKWPHRKQAQATIDEVRAAFHKQHWQLPLKHRGNYQWTWLYGTNFADMRTLKERGFVDAESNEGLGQLDVLRTTKKERMRRLQMEMHFDE